MTFWCFMSNNAMADVRVPHVSEIVEPLVKMFTHCCFALTYLMLVLLSCCTTSYNHARLTHVCSRHTWFIGVTCLFITILIVAVLSPPTRSACSIAIVTASVELWLAVVCPVHAATIGANCPGPTKASNNPVVGSGAKRSRSPCTIASGNPEWNHRCG